MKKFTMTVSMIAFLAIGMVTLVTPAFAGSSCQNDCWYDWGVQFNACNGDAQCQFVADRGLEFCLALCNGGPF